MLTRNQKTFCQHLNWVTDWKSFCQHFNWHHQGNQLQHRQKKVFNCKLVTGKLLFKYAGANLACKDGNPSLYSVSFSYPSSVSLSSMRKTSIRGYWQNDCWWVMAVITTGVCVSPSRFINCLSYYVLAMNAGSLGGNRYVNFTLSGLVDIPSLIICFFLIKRFAVCKCSSIISRPQMRNRVLVRSTDGFTCLSEQISNRFMHAQDFIRPLWIEEHQPNCMFTDWLKCLVY